MDHWHPVLKSKELGRRPVGILLNGRSLVLFRNAAGQIGVLDDCCPHRRMRLSLGKVVGERLQCPYHGWTFGCDGAGESPGTPKLHAQATAYHARELYGAVWVKSVESDPLFPVFDVAGYYHLCTLRHQARAPLEVALDNFTEIEHTPIAHALFGYDPGRMHEVTVQFLPTDTTTHVVNAGPPKRLSWFNRFLLGIGPDYQFNDVWTTNFSPVYSVFDHWWSDPATGREGMVRWRIYIFLVPQDAGTTGVVTFVFTKSRWPGPAGAVRLFKRRLVRMMTHEIDLDVGLLANLADKSVGLEGMKLSRFDRVLGQNRERIQRVYRGLPE
jgi:phenylpropionate dioxygenase-like ring-hydroxylating dioxygenase large terminal subunit